MEVGEKCLTQRNPDQQGEEHAQTVTQDQELEVCEVGEVATLSPSKKKKDTFKIADYFATLPAQACCYRPPCSDKKIK